MDTAFFHFLIVQIKKIRNIRQRQKAFSQAQKCFFLHHPFPAKYLIFKSYNHLYFIFELAYGIYFTPNAPVICIHYSPTY